MAGHGSQPGERLGGRQKGTKNKATIEHENMISRAIGELNRPLGKLPRCLQSGPLALSAAPHHLG